VVGVAATVIFCGFGWGHPQEIFLTGLPKAGNTFGYFLAIIIRSLFLKKLVK